MQTEKSLEVIVDPTGLQFQEVCPLTGMYHPTVGLYNPLINPLTGIVHWMKANDYTEVVESSEVVVTTPNYDTNWVS